jgi:hypothetical protein
MQEYKQFGHYGPLIKQATENARSAWEAGDKVASNRFSQQSKDLREGWRLSADEEMKKRKQQDMESAKGEVLQPIRKAPPGYQLQGPPGKPYGFRNQTTGAYEWFADMDEMMIAHKAQQIKQSLPYSYIQNELSTLEKAKGISDPVKRNIFLQSKEMGGYRAKDLQAIEERIAQIKSRLPRKGQPTTPRTDLNYDPSKSSFSRAMQDLQNMKE